MEEKIQVRDYEQCMELIMTELCVGDYVEVYPRGLRAMVIIRGRVKRLGPMGLLVSDGTREFAIRLSEIRMIAKLKEEGENNG